MKFNLIKKIRLLTKFRREPYLAFKKVLGFFPCDIEFYQMAVRHRSMPLRTKSGQYINNERLEFLGDAVLSAVVSDVLYYHYPDKKEGFLTNARSNIVKRSSLNKMCKSIGLDKLIVADNQVFDSKKTYAYGNALEALIGAIYLDLGYGRCMKFIKKRILISLDSMYQLAEDDENYKSKLLEWCQQRYYSLDFELLEETVDAGNEHLFVSQVLIGGKPICKGSGRSKKESHQQASLRALELIEKHGDFLERFDVPHGTEQT